MSADKQTPPPSQRSNLCAICGAYGVRDVHGKIRAWILAWDAEDRECYSHETLYGERAERPA